MPVLACPSCSYDLGHLAGERLLECPECGRTCTKREAMQAPYRGRTKGLTGAKVLVSVGTFGVVVTLCAGAFIPGVWLAAIAWLTAVGLIFAGWAVYARCNRHGFGRWWPVVGIGIGAGWVVLVHAVLISASVLLVLIVSAL